MKLKKYYADNMQDALKIIKEEIGPDAVILSSKFVRKRKGFLGLFAGKQIEVVAGYEEEAAKAARQPKPTYAEAGKFASLINDASAYAARTQPAAQNTNVKPAPIPSANTTDAAVSATAKMEEIVQKNTRETNAGLKKIETLDESISELKQIVSGINVKMENLSAGDRVKFSKDVRDLFNKLIENDVERNLATELCAKTEDIVSDREAEPKEVLLSLMLDLLGKVKPIECTKFKRKTVMLIGPTGVGKTTTLVKLASKLLYEQKLDIGVINADVFRVAAKEHLKAYCEILNAEMITIYRQSEIVDALEAFKTKDIVFIDTAGKLSSNKQYQEEIKELVNLGAIDDIYLLISASTSEKVIKSIINDYSFLKIHSIIVTKVDETPTKGVVLHVAKESGRPLSYMTIGQNVPDDIVELDPQDIANSVLES